MRKFLITHKLANPVTGPIMVTTSPRATCPGSCPLKGALCYAERGYLGGYIWNGLDRTRPLRSFGNGIRVYTFKELLAEIRKLPPGAIWRHNQAGDLMPESPGIISKSHLEAIVGANKGRRGFTYTHYDPYLRSNYHAILDANVRGFTINLSANSLEHADHLADLAIASVTVVLPAGTRGTVATPKGRPVLMCPAIVA